LQLPIFKVEIEMGLRFSRSRQSLLATTAEAPVRTAISVSPDGNAVYFGDQHASAYAVDAISGKLLWKTHIDEHPAAIVTGAPTLAEASFLYRCHPTRS
jgi:hypothetical protein